MHANVFKNHLIRVLNIINSYSITENGYIKLVLQKLQLIITISFQNDYDWLYILVIFPNFQSNCNLNFESTVIMSLDNYDNTERDHTTTAGPTTPSSLRSYSCTDTHNYTYERLPSSSYQLYSPVPPYSQYILY